MNATEARHLLLQTLAEIAPDADAASVTDDTDLRDEFELDSLDFLSFVERISRHTGVDVREDDYARFRTVAGGVAFLTAVRPQPTH